ncbi:hypothetical protein DL98DRAFT_233489 [Cadophora sp. DSE1049]|nr:hypothetical protein DL98DRAFT_233489 [Cadophora sp. DSE1049]
MSQYATAARLCLMFAVADVTHYAHTATRTELGLRTHRTRMTAALEKIAKVNNILIEDLHQDKRRSRNYFELVLRVGPGALLLIGSEAVSWETNTSKGDIGLVLEYIATYLPQLYNIFKSLNGIGARTIVKGFLAHGWTVEEVKSCPIPFTTKVRTYLDENLMPKTEGVVPTTQHPCTGNQSSKKRVVDEIRTGNTKEDHAHKVHTSRQRSFALDDQPTETSPPDAFGVGHHCPGSSSITASAGDILDDVTTRHIEDDSMDPWMAGTLRSCVDSTGSGQTQAVSMDPHMTSTLCAVDCLPSSLQQDPRWERVLTIDPHMMSTLGAVGSLPSSLESSSSRERALTINPNLLTIDPHMTSSLGAVECLPSSLQQDPSRQRELTRDPNIMEDIEGYSQTFSRQGPWP